uniref:Uncharacterized protein n=1 Tax=Siphoviridae sp. ctneY2 TaxID=2825664 RepID=A0A8S5V7C6_9CAUD|nr:MAG TPA: hypothetical protein [Siphoviridae sp. ctneY2]
MISTLIRSPLDADNRYTDLHRIIYCVFSSALFSIEYCNDSGCVVNHPFVSDLKAGSAVALTDIFHEVCGCQYLFVLSLPFLAPTTLKAIIGAGTHKFDTIALITKHQHNLCCPDIYAPCHARNKDIQSVSNCLTDFFFQILFDGSVRACQLLRAVSREAYSVHSFFGFGHISPLRDSCLTNITSYHIPILVSTRMYFISHLGSKIDMRKVVMLWIRTLVSSSYCGNADGRSTNFQKSAVWHSPLSETSSEEIQFLPLRPLRRYAEDSASLCRSSSLTPIWSN